MEPFLGEIKMFGGNFAPRGYAFCNGQLIAIAQNSALFSILGTTYGGDGITTFALPDFRGRVPMNWGQGPGLTSRQLGESSGEENHTLIVNEMPSHTHTVSVLPGCSTEDAETGVPTGKIPAAVPTNAFAAAANASMGASNGTAAPAGGSAPHNNLQPYLAVSFIIALEGVFPSRN